MHADIRAAQSSVQPVDHILVVSSERLVDVMEGRGFTKQVRNSLKWSVDPLVSHYKRNYSEMNRHLGGAVDFSDAGHISDGEP